jgi:hypothetical protein
MFGSRCLKTRSQTQEMIALSSGESELLWNREGDDDGDQDQELVQGPGVGGGDSGERGEFDT